MKHILVAWSFGLVLLMLSMVGARAELYTRCQPILVAGDPADRDWQTRMCDAENAVYDRWEQRLIDLSVLREDLSRAAISRDWEGYRGKLAMALPIMRGLRDDATANPSVRGAANMLDLYGPALGYFFQNASLSLVNGLDDAMSKIDAALSTSKAGNYAAVGITIVMQSVTRGHAFIRNLGPTGKSLVAKERKDQAQALTADRKRKLDAADANSYFLGFGTRINWALAIVLFSTIGVSAFVGFGLYQNGERRTARFVLKLAVLTFGVMLVFMTLYVFIPWVNQWWAYLIVMAIVGYLFLASEEWPIWNGFFQLHGVGTAAAVPTPIGVTSAGLGAGAGSHGSARWGSIAWMTGRQHLLEKHAVPVGLVMGRAPNVPDNYDNRFRLQSHVTTFAPTGSGKGIGAVIPTLIEYPGSVFALDIKGENYAVTARARREAGQAVYLFDPFGVTKDRPHAINPLDRLDITSANVVGDAAAITDMLVIANSHEKNRHWNDSAKDLLRGLLIHVVSLDDPARRTLGEVRRLLTTGPKEWADTLAKMASSEAAFGVVARSANALIGKPEEERGSVKSTAQRHTAFLDDPRVADALSRSDFTFDRLKQELMTVYLAMPLDRLETQSRLVRVILGAAQSAVMATSQQPAHKVLFLLDEFGQLGYVPSVETGISLIRGYGGVFWLFFQDLGQLKPIYPKWQSLQANTAKQFFGTADFDTAKYVSDTMGKATIDFETESSSSHSGLTFGSVGGFSRGRSQSENEQVTGRELLTPDEVMRLGPTRPLVLISGEPPYLLDRIAYFRDPDYLRLADPNPYHL